MAIDVSKQLEDEIAEHVRREHHHSADDFLRRALRDANTLRELRKSIANARGQAERGELVDGEEFLERMDAQLAEEERRETKG